MNPAILSETIQEFDGIRYYLNRNRYFQNVKKPESLLHRAVWIHHKGAIPKGMHIHHKDHNPINNTIDNLECLTPKEHGGRHVGDPGWHGSEEGRLWHKNQYQAQTKFLFLKRRTLICRICRQEFVANNYRSVFCSPKCRSVHYRNRNRMLKKMKSFVEMIAKGHQIPDLVDRAKRILTLDQDD